MTAELWQANKVIRLSKNMGIPRNFLEFALDSPVQTGSMFLYGYIPQFVEANSRLEKAGQPPLVDTSKIGIIHVEDDQWKIEYGEKEIILNRAALLKLLDSSEYEI